jgi:hypothetical protein
MSTAASSTPSRLAPARRRARLLKVTSAGAAVAGFGILSLLVRSGAHAGGAAATSTPTSSATGGLELSSRISEEAADGGSFFGSGSSSGSVSPSQSTDPPQASTHTS